MNKTSFQKIHASKLIFPVVQLFGLPLVIVTLEDFVTRLLVKIKARKNLSQKNKQLPLAIMVVSMQDVMVRWWWQWVGAPRAAAAAFAEFDWFTPDGMPLVWLARLLGYRAQRIYGPDVLVECLHQTNYEPDGEIRHYFYGSTPETLQKLKTQIRRHWPGVVIAGSLAPPFRPLTPAEKTRILVKINRSQPDIIWVGLGSWKQLLWVAEMKARLSTSVIIPVGLAFKILSGETTQAPKWWRQSGGEWLFRLIQEPNRLWSRYWWQVPFFGVWWIVELINQLCQRVKWWLKSSLLRRSSIS